MSRPSKPELAVRRSGSKVTNGGRGAAPAPVIRSGKSEPINYYQIYKTGPLERIRILKDGVLASTA